MKWAGTVAAALVGGLGLLSLTIEPSQVSLTSATGPILAPPSRTYPLGTDESGLSVLDLTLYGAQRSLLIAALSTGAAVGLGIVVGVLAGHFPGWPDTVLSRVSQWFLVLPNLPLAICLAAVLGAGLAQLSTAIALACWPVTARVVRAAVVSAESQPYLDRVRALGAGHWRQIRVHTWPAILPVIISCVTLTLGNALLSEATLSYFGLGEPSSVSWGGMLNKAANSGAITAGAWWYLLAPGLAITAVVLACGVAGRATETALGPLSRRSWVTGPGLLERIRSVRSSHSTEH